MKTKKPWLIMLLLLCLLMTTVAGCNTEIHNTENNTTDETSTAGTETETESGSETTTEVETESGSENSTEVETESGSENSTEVETESGSENSTEAESESGTEVSTEAETESESETLDPSLTLAPEWVGNLTAAADTTQIIIVAATGNTADFAMYEKTSSGHWTEVLIADKCYIGANGLGKTKEGDYKTPIGIFRFTRAFGIKEHPGTAMDYLVVDSSHYWVDDADSPYYNQFVSTKEITKQWDSAEHIIDYVPSYNYCLSLNYNPDRIAGKGSAIFLHCINKGATAGCIAIPEDDMFQVLTSLREDCIIIIDTPEGVTGY